MAPVFSETTALSERDRLMRLFDCAEALGGCSDEDRTTLAWQHEAAYTLAGLVKIGRPALEPAPPQKGERERTIEECARLVEGENYKARYRVWPAVMAGDLHRDDAVTVFADKAAAALRTLASSPPAHAEQSTQWKVQVKAFKSAALEAIQALRHAAACNFTPAYSGSIGEARTDSFYEAWKAVHDLPLPPPPATRERP